MDAPAPTISDDLLSYQSVGEPITVKLSYSLVRLLSEQLYQSPLKAVEELVVNAYDANAKDCRIFVPTAGQDEFVAIYDDGDGMDYRGLVDLWQIGHSAKRDEEIKHRTQRKQIGKFGIGKLAAYTIANQLTYMTKKEGQVLAITIDFRSFDPSPEGTPHQSDRSNFSRAEIEEVDLIVHKMDDWSGFADSIHPVFDKLDLTETDLDTKESWTLAILENLKDKGRTIRRGRLEWVLSTAMPRHTEFELFLNGEEVVSSKEDYEVITQFEVSEMPKHRLEALSNATGENWHKDQDQLKTDGLFNEGIRGTVTVTQESLVAGKSGDVGRSHGFFIRVRDRLINEGDPLFGLKPRVHETFNRFDAQICADNLDEVLTASRDSIEETHITDVFRAFLAQVFREADLRYQNEIEKRDKETKEGEKKLVKPRLVEYPLADALLTQSYDNEGPEADEGWFYIEVESNVDLAQLVKNLYTEQRSKYRYQYVSGTQTDRVVRFDPAKAIFRLNEAHEFVQENMDSFPVRQLLHDFVTAEMLLEIYMRESHIPAHIIGGILEQRDKLLRALARDRSYSFNRIAKALRESAADEHELEINLVVAMRALGFTAKQVSGGGNPDGMARYTNYPGGEKRLTLEAKSSQDTPTLAQLDFAGVSSHKTNSEADGCLLLAPSYPGESRGEDSEVARRARELEISCWTVEHLARIVESAEKRHLNATHVIEIVENCYTPDQVTRAIDSQLSEPNWDNRTLYRGILKALKHLHGRLPDRPRSIDLVSGRVVEEDGLRNVLGEHVEKAIRDLAVASQGGMTVDGPNVLVHVALEELERRVEHLTNPQATSPRRRSSFRHHE